MALAHGRILLIMLAAVVALAAGETFLSKGMKQAGREGDRWTAQAVALVSNGWVWADAPADPPPRTLHGGAAQTPT